MVAIDETALNVFTDGSCYSHPRRGGLGAKYIWVNEKGEEETSDYLPIGYKGATNNQMELQVCIDVLKAVWANNTPIDLGSVSKVIIYSDSMYVVDNWDRAVYERSRSKWLSRQGRPILNAEQWQELVKLRMKIRKKVVIKWVKGHKDDQNNKAVDKLAKHSAQIYTKRHLSIVNVRRKLSNQPTVSGSVALAGQKLKIRVIEDEWLKVQRCFKYRYEVISKGSRSQKCVDWAFSDPGILLSAGHVYSVRFNDNMDNPRIVKLYREYEKDSVGGKR